MIKLEQLSEIGKFLKTHALKGELNALLEVPVEFLDEGNPVIALTDGLFVPYFPESVRKKGATTYLIKLEGVDSETEAKTFVNKTIYALKDKLKTFYQEEGEEMLESDGLIGFKVIDSSSGVLIGEIVLIDDSTSNILLHVKKDNDEIVFIPVVEDWIVKIDEDGRVFEMDFPEGLLDLNVKKKEE